MHPSPHPSPSRGLQVLGWFRPLPHRSKWNNWIRWVDKKRSGWDSSPTSATGVPSAGGPGRIQRAPTPHKMETWGFQ